jgi:poly-beta-hydroxyalkanoate depolymerase
MKCELVVFNDRLVVFYYYFLSCLDLSKTLFLATIQGLFASQFGLTSKGFWISFVSGSNQSTRIDPLGLIIQELFKLM